MTIFRANSQGFLNQTVNSHLKIYKLQLICVYHFLSQFFSLYKEFRCKNSGGEKRWRSNFEESYNLNIRNTFVYVITCLSQIQKSVRPN
jgi:hypothetical protein